MSDFELKYLKVATPRMAGYTGVLGPVRFKDGVSVEMLPRHIRDRMGASMELIEVDAEGNEQPAGAQHRVIREYKERAPKAEPLKRQTEAEKAAEVAASAVMNGTKLPDLETRTSLEKLAAEKGIKGLRVIGGKWGVKHRSIPTLIEMILDAQDKSVAARGKKLEVKEVTETAPADHADDSEIVTIDETEQKADTEQPDAEVSDKTVDAAAAVSAKLADAAASGDLAAALNTEE